MTITIMILGILGIIFQLISRKMKEDEKPPYLVASQYIVMFLIVIFGAYSQIESSTKEKEYRHAKLEIDILAKVSQYYHPVIENMIKIQNNFSSIKNYLSFEKAKKDHPELSKAINWYKTVSKSHISGLETAKNSFYEIRSIAAEIVKLSIEYDSILPSKIVEWANTTLNIRFEDIETYFDPFASVEGKPIASVLDYNRNTGEAFGLIMGRIRNAVNVIKTI